MMEQIETINSVVLDILPILISVIALISSIIIGRRQVKIYQMQVDFQNKVELYLLFQAITLKDMNNTIPDEMVPAICIRNIGTNVVYLEKYVFNGREYPLGQQVLPPVSAYDGYRYIFLPTDGTTHISLTISFQDWQHQKWETVGYADLSDGRWEITYSPCERK